MNASSCLAKLRNKSKATGKSFQSLLSLFCQEEFLRKLALSKYSENLVLKGGMFIYTLTNFESRGTVDIDFLLNKIPSGVADVSNIIDEILSIKTGNDFIVIEKGVIETISPQRKYQGVTCQLIGKIENTRTPFSIDFGVGDVIVPNAVWRNIPVQLESFAVPKIKTYSLESTIAEKVDALLQRLELSSRMKDIYDIYYLSKMFEFDIATLAKALKATMDNRKTIYSEQCLHDISALPKSESMIKMWNKFLKTVHHEGELSFENVIESICQFLKSPWEIMLSISPPK